MPDSSFSRRFGVCLLRKDFSGRSAELGLVEPPIHDAVFQQLGMLSRGDYPAPFEHDDAGGGKGRLFLL